VQGPPKVPRWDSPLSDKADCDRISHACEYEKTCILLNRVRLLINRMCILLTFCFFFAVNVIDNGNDNETNTMLDL